MASRPQAGALRLGAVGYFVLAAAQLLPLAGGGAIAVAAGAFAIAGTFLLCWGFAGARRLTGGALAQATVAAYVSSCALLIAVFAAGLATSARPERWLVYLFVAAGLVQATTSIVAGSFFLQSRRLWGEAVASIAAAAAYATGVLSLLASLAPLGVVRLPKEMAYIAIIAWVGYGLAAGVAFLGASARATPRG